jgi:Spy/CpxP family protein refolding chaperone
MEKENYKETNPMNAKNNLSTTQIHQETRVNEIILSSIPQRVISGALMVAAVALLSLSVPVTAFSEMKDMPMKGHACEHGPMMEMGHMEKMGAMMDKCVEHAEMMGLTDAQMMKMKPIHREMQKKHARFTADVKIAEIELMEIMEVKDFDLDKATAAVKKIAEIKTAYHLEMLKTMKEVRPMLTDEQFTKMKKMMSMKMGEKKHDKKSMKKHSNPAKQDK